MPALPNPHPMVTFDPTRPADVHDQLNDKIIRWKPEWAATWQDRRDHAPGVIEWDGLLLDGWVPTQDALDRPAQGAPSQLAQTGAYLK